jgi:hypothetical protein
VKDNQTLPEIERILQNHAALPALQKLVDDGCDRVEVLAALAISFVTDETWKTLIGMELREFQRALKQIKTCADMIDRLNGTDLVYGLAVERLDPLFVALHQSPTLSERLREYVGVLELRRMQFGPKRKIRAHVWKAHIMAIVIEDARSPHDKEVSAIVGAVMDHPNYSEKAHQKWRLDNQVLIDMMRTKLQERRRRRSSSLPPI